MRKWPSCKTKNIGNDSEINLISSLKDLAIGLRAGQNQTHARFTGPSGQRNRPDHQLNRFRKELTGLPPRKAILGLGYKTLYYSMSLFLEALAIFLP